MQMHKIQIIQSKSLYLFDFTLMFFFLHLFQDSIIFLIIYKFYGINYFWFHLLLLYTDDFVGRSLAAINLLIDTWD